MIAKIVKLKEVIDADSRRIKSIGKTLNKIELLINKDDFISALRISENSLKPVLINMYPNLVKDLDEFCDQLKNQARKFKIDFNSNFIASCKESRLSPIVGDTRKGFRIKGIIEISVDFEKGNVKIGTYSKRHRINSLKIKDIISGIEKVDKRLFQRAWDSKKFFSELSEAYTSVSKGRWDEEIPLKKVQSEIWMRKQTGSFWKSFDKEDLRDYPTDEFSVDLSRLISSKPKEANELDVIRSAGAGAIIVYDNNGNFKSFKFLTFRKRGVS